MSNKLFLLIMISILSTISCSESDFTKYVEVEVPESEQKLVLLAPMDHAVNRHEFVVTRTKGINQGYQFRNLEVDDARLITPDQGELLIPFGVRNTYDISYDFIPGEEYELKLSDSDLGNISAKTRVPKQLEIVSISVDTMENDVFDIVFADPADEKNYYRFIGQTTVENDRGEICTDSYYFDYTEDDLLSDNDWLSDLGFNGSNKRIKLSGYSYCNGVTVRRISYKITILSIPEEQVDYERSVELAWEAEDNPFVEPTTLYTNVEGGLGIFSVTTSTVIEGKF